MLAQPFYVAYLVAVLLHRRDYVSDLVQLPIGEHIARDERVAVEARWSRWSRDCMVEETSAGSQQRVQSLEVVGRALQPDVLEHAD